MPATRGSEPDSVGVAQSPAPTKRRRTFFASTLAINPLQVSATSRPAITPRSKVLAALHEPEQPKKAQANPPPAPVAREKSQRIVKRVTESQSVARPISPAKDKGKEVERGEKSIDGDAEAGPSESAMPVKKRNRPSVRPFSDGTNRHAPTPTTTRKKTTKVTVTLTSRKTVKIPAEPSTPRARSSKATKAQTTNERLSAMMAQSIKATIDGRTRPYTRVPVWEEGEESKPTPSPSHKRSSFSAKVKVKTDAKAGPSTTSSKKRKSMVDEEASEAENIGHEDVNEAPSGKGKGKGKAKGKSGSTKSYMAAGFYCQDANAKSPFKLVNRVLSEGALLSPVNTKYKRSLAANSLLPAAKRISTAMKEKPISFPPLPYDHGYQHFFGEEHDFVLPYNIQQEAETGALNSKKKPAPYQKLRGNVFPDRSRYVTEEKAICKCDPDSGCGENCINRIMSYLCGRDCPSGEACTNRSLTRRPGASTKVVWTGTRGFGLFTTEDIKEGDFVTDYRGEVISLNKFYQRINDQYAGQKNFYALAYDQDEVIDSGMRGNDARFINHGCDPNLEVRKYQTMGDGWEEFEIGMWAIKDIKAGDELFYDYNFDNFDTRQEDLRTQCRCGAPNCIGFLGRKSGEKKKKDLPVGLQAKKAAGAARTLKGKKVVKRTVTKSGSGRGAIKFSGAVQRAKKAVAMATKAAKRKPTKADPKEARSEELSTAKATALSSGAMADQVLDPTSVPSTATEANQSPSTLNGPSTSTTHRGSTAPPQTPSRATDTVPDGLPADEDQDGAESPTPSEMDSQTSASIKKRSGWTNWLRKIAAEKERTLEDWHEERIKRRKGIAWMNMMIAEFGVAPSASTSNPESYSDGRKPAGSSASFANTLAAQGFGAGPQAVRNLGGPMHHYKKENFVLPHEEVRLRGVLEASKPRPTPGGRAQSLDESRVPATKFIDLPKSFKVPESQAGTMDTASGPTEALKDVGSITGAIVDPAASTPVPGVSSSTTTSPVRSQRGPYKVTAKAKRNGAPAGWVYTLATDEPAVASVGQVILDLPRGARRARLSGPAP